MLDKYKPKSLGDWGIVLALGGAAAISFGILKKFEFESETETEIEVGDYELESGIDFEFEIDKNRRHRKKGGRNKN